MSKNNNGNNQLNGARDSVNKNVKKLKGLGSTKGATWKSNRRNSSI